MLVRVLLRLHVSVKLTVGAVTESGPHLFFNVPNRTDKFELRSCHKRVVTVVTCCAEWLDFSMLVLYMGQMHV